MAIGVSNPAAERRRLRTRRGALFGSGLALTTLAAAAWGLTPLVLKANASSPPKLSHMPRLKMLPAPQHPTGKCPSGMVLIRNQFCIDAYEASTVRVDEKNCVIGEHSPYEMKKSDRVRAESAPGVHPQAHITLDQARTACERAEKRLCSDDEWLKACRGEHEFKFPYGPHYERGRCNDRASSPFFKLLGHEPPASVLSSPVALNNPRLNQQGGLAKTGAFAGCRTAEGVFDMVGNLHEWTADPRGTFRGGYYRDAREHGQGCSYVTKGHDAHYRDYSTGFRCCAEPRE